MSHTISTTVDRGFAETLDATRARLADAGFGVLTEIDMAATLKAKIGAEIAPQVILGACRPPLALAALEAEPTIGVFLPCNVVVRAIDEQHTLVEAMDPDAMVGVTGNQALADIAADARKRISAALDALSSEPVSE